MLRFLTILVAALSGLPWASITLAADPDSAAASVQRDQVKVAAVQINGYDKGELPRPGYDAADALVPYIKRAAGDGCQLVVFPEYVLGHITAPGPSTDKLAAAARSGSIYVIVGGWEEFGDDKFANTALLFDRQGQIVGKYRKTHAAVDHFAGEPPWRFPPEGKSRAWMREHDPEWIMERGAELPVFELDFGKVGILTCYDGWFPEPARVLSLKGAELVVWINGRGGAVEDFIVKTTIFQSHVAMITTNQAYGGGTMIADPSDGPATILQRAPDKQEAYITATLDLARVRARRASSRNFQQRRPDLYGKLSEQE